MNLPIPRLTSLLVLAEAVERNRPEDARRYFQPGARYADKRSQALMAELLWDGRDSAADRALGHAWMDLAAKRERNDCRAATGTASNR